MKPKQFYYVLAGILALLVAGGGYGYYAANQQLAAQTDSLKQHLASIDVIDSQIDDLAQLDHQYQKFSPLLSQLNQVLPHSKNQAQLVLQLNRLANANGMTLPAVAFANSSGLPGSLTQTEKADGGFDMPVTIQLTGSYDQMQSFLQGLEKLDRFTNVSTLAIAKTDKPKQLSFNLTIKAYLKP